MLQPAVTLTDSHHEEQVVLEGCLAAEEFYLPFAYLLQIGTQAFLVEARTPRDRHLMRYATCALNFSSLERAHLERDDHDQLIVISCGITPKPPCFAVPRAARAASWRRASAAKFCVPARFASARLRAAACSRPATLRNICVPLKKPCVWSRCAQRTDRSQA